MSRNLKIKGDILNLSDGRYFAALGADWVSVQMNPENPAFIHPKNALEIKNWLYGPQLIAVFEFSRPDTVESVIETLQPDGIQLLGNYDISWMKSLQKTVFKEIILDEQSTFESIKSEFELYSEVSEYFVLNLRTANLAFEQLENEKGNLTKNQLIGIIKEYPVILDGVFNPENIIQVTETYQPAGLNLRGGSEDKVGLKSFENLDKIVEKLGLDEY